MSSSRGTVIEGIGDDLVYAGSALFGGTFVLIATIVYWTKMRHQNYEIHPDSQASVLDARERLSQHSMATDPERRTFRGSDIMCPICLGERQLSVETNCGHIFCGQCITTYWQHGNWLGAVRCPICRQEVSILLHNFSDIEMESPSEEKSSIIHLIAMYNRRFSGRPVALLDQLRDLPTLLRHLVAEFFSLHGLVLMFRIRLIVCCVMAFIYIVSPLDIIPESAFGILGLLDDVFVMVLLAVYASVLYRRYVADQAMDDD